ncbi:Ribokinase-like protein [Collybia nuda]|uniref:Ribokinase n=1 Tax=Collybia nuda TaxID=64659 RepID=A0A9P5XUP9_9AGAR|nr:Ribokinase-like protein [Collybia nuda]
MANSRCAVRGSINNDEYFYVRDIARPGETISSHHYESRVGGKGANQAIAITKAGGIADFYGTVGHDGLWVKKRATEFGLDDAGIIVGDDPTGRALIQVSDTGENSIILFPGANHSRLHEKTWSGRAEHSFPNSSHLLLQNEIHMDSTLYALKNAQNTTIIFNPSPLPSTKEIAGFPWHKVDWLIVNEGETRDLYEALFGHGNSGTTSTMSNRKLIASLSAQSAFASTNIICTLGKDGVLAFIPTFHRRNTMDGSPSFLQLPAAKLQGHVRDTTGAGDCFTGYFVQGLMEHGPHAKVGREIQEHDIVCILKICVQAAGMCVEREGTIDSIPTRAEVDVRMSSA